MMMNYIFNKEVVFENSSYYCAQTVYICSIIDATLVLVKGFLQRYMAHFSYYQ